MLRFSGKTSLPVLLVPLETHELMKTLAVCKSQHTEDACTGPCTAFHKNKQNTKKTHKQTNKQTKEAGLGHNKT